MRNDAKYREKIQRYYRERHKRHSELRNRHCKHEPCGKLLHYTTEGDYCQTHREYAKGEKKKRRKN